MNKKLFTFATLGATVLALSLTACSGKNESRVDADGTLHGEISLSGAFALYPLAVQWANEFQKLHPDVTQGVCPSVTLKVGIGATFLQLHADAEYFGHQQCKEAFAQRFETIYHSIPEAAAYKEESQEHQEHAT